MFRCALSRLPVALIVLALCGPAPAQNLDELFRAVQEPSPTVATQLLDKYPTLVKSQDTRGYTALWKAAYMKRPEMANLLVARGADVNQPTLRGSRPIHAVGHNGCQEILTLLLANGADVQAVDGGGRSALHWAAYGGYLEVTNKVYLEIVSQLLAAKAQVDVQDAYGQTPLHMAAGAGKTAGVERLLQAGAKPDIVDAHGRTPLQLCQHSKHGEWEKVQALLQPKP